MEVEDDTPADSAVDTPTEWPVWLSLTPEGEWESRDELLAPPVPAALQITFLILGLCILIGLWGVIFFTLRALREGETGALTLLTLVLVAEFSRDAIGLALRPLRRARAAVPTPGGQPAVFLGWLTGTGIRTVSGTLWPWSAFGGYAFSRGELRWFCIRVRWGRTSPTDLQTALEALQAQSRLATWLGRIGQTAQRWTFPVVALLGTIYGWYLYGPRLDVGAAVCVTVAALAGRLALTLEQRQEVRRIPPGAELELLFDTRQVSAQEVLCRLNQRGEA